MNSNIPLVGGYVDTAKQGLGYIQQFQKSGLFTRVAEIAGSSPGLELKEFEGSDATKKKNFLFYIRRYLLTWGNIVGVVGVGLSRLVKNFITEESSKFLQPIGMISWLAGLAGIGIAIYSHVTGKTFDRYVGQNERIKKMGIELLDKVQEILKNDDLIAKAKNSPLRFRTEIWDRLNGDVIRAEERKLGVKLFLTGFPGTGKTEGMDFVTAKIIEQEESKKIDKREVVTLRIKGKSLREEIESKKQSRDSLTEGFNMLVSFANIDPQNTEEVAKFLSQTKTQLLKGVMLGLAKKYKEYESQGKRLVVQIDEIDELWSVAKRDGKYDEDFITEVSGALGELFDENNKYDILCTSNESVEGLVGLYTNFEGDPKRLEASNMAKVYRRLGQMCTPILPPDYETKTKIMHVYLNRYLKPVSGAIDDTEVISRVTLGGIINSSESEAAKHLMEIFNETLRIDKIPTLNEENGREYLEGLLRKSARSTKDLEQIYQMIKLKMGFEKLTGAGIKDLVDQELLNLYRTNGGTISIRTFVNKVESKISAIAKNLTSVEMKDVDEVFAPYKTALKNAELKMIENEIVNGRDQEKFAKAKENIDLVRVRDNVARLSQRVKGLKPQDFKKLGSSEMGRETFELYKDFKAKYLNETSPSLCLRTLNEDELEETNLTAGQILGMIDSVLDEEPKKNPVQL